MSLECKELKHTIRYLEENTGIVSDNLCSERWVLPEPGEVLVEPGTQLEDIDHPVAYKLHETTTKIYRYWAEVHHPSDSLSNGWSEVRSVIYPHAGPAYIPTYNLFVIPPNYAEDVGTIGHEFAHKMMSYGARFFYGGQSGILEESLADFFGVRARQYSSDDPNDQHWWVAGRNMQDPPQAISLPREPDHRAAYDLDQTAYHLFDSLICSGGLCTAVGVLDWLDPELAKQLDNYRLFLTPFHGGMLLDCLDQLSGYSVHQYTGILNKAWYLMSMGSDGLPVHGVTVEGIGPERVEEILYEVIRPKSDPESDYFSHTRDQWGYSHPTFDDMAKAVYNACHKLSETEGSFEGVDCRNVTDAFAAVGIYPGCYDFDGDRFGKGPHCIAKDCEDTNEFMTLCNAQCSNNNQAFQDSKASNKSTGSFICEESPFCIRTDRSHLPEISEEAKLLRDRAVSLLTYGDYRFAFVPKRVKAQYPERRAKAIELLLQAIQLYPQYDDAYFNLAVIEDPPLPNRLEYLQKAIDISPQYRPRLVDVLEGEGRYEEALKVARALYKECPNELWRLLGVLRSAATYLAHKANKEGYSLEIITTILKLWEEFYSLNNKAPRHTRDSLGDDILTQWYVIRAKQFLKMGLIEEAKLDLDKANTFRSQKREVWLDLAVLNTRVGNVEKARFAREMAAKAKYFWSCSPTNSVCQWVKNN